MDAHIAELISSDGASAYTGFGGGSSVSVTGPSAFGGFSLGNAQGNNAGWALIAAIIVLVVVYAKTRGDQK